MSDAPPTIVSVTSSLESDANEVLEEAKSQGFESVIVFGLKGDDIHYRHSRFTSRLKMLGALEAAKQAIWDSD